MKKFTFKETLQKLQLTTLRFPFPLFFLIGLACLFFIQINNHHADIKQYIWTFFALGIPVSVVLSLFAEEFSSKILKIGLNLSCIVLLMLYCFFLPEKFVPVNFYQVISLGIVFVLLAFVVSYFGKGNDISFWEFSKSSVIQLVISFIFAAVLMAGLSLAILSLNFLFKIDVKQEVYQNLSIFCFVLFAPVYFLTNITSADEMHLQKFEFNKFLKVLGLYILLPILGLYSLILYVYLIRIIVKWELPDGWVSTLVSVLGLGGFVTMLILFPLRQENENKVVRSLYRFFPVILIPLLVLMSVGIFRRFDDYGITINRLYVLILNVWLYGICIYLFGSKSIHLKWIIISFSSVLFFVSIGPWSVYSITKKSVEKDIKSLLIENKLFVDNKLVDNTIDKIKINDSIKIKISDKIVYYVNNFGVDSWKSAFNDNRKLSGTFQIREFLGLGNRLTNIGRFSIFSANTLNETIDIKDYSYVIANLKYDEDSSFIFSDKNYKIELVENTIQISNLIKKSNVSFPLQPIISKLYADSESQSLKNKLLLQKSDSYMLLINNISVQCKSSTHFKIQQLDFILYIK